jgi:hypothetical protein
MTKDVEKLKLELRKLALAQLEKSRQVKRFNKIAHAFTSEHTHSKRDAQEALALLGIYTTNGKLKKIYR